MLNLEELTQELLTEFKNHELNFKEKLNEINEEILPEIADQPKINDFLLGTMFTLVHAIKASTEEVALKDLPFLKNKLTDIVDDKKSDYLGLVAGKIGGLNALMKLLDGVTTDMDELIK